MKGFLLKNINKFNLLSLNSDFGKNVITLVSGTTIAQAIPILLSPVLTRLYSPKDFGFFTAFIAIIFIFESIVCGRYELSIMLPKKRDDALNLFLISITIALLTSIVTVLLVALLKDYIGIVIFKNQDAGICIYLLPIAVLLIGLYNTLIYYHNREKLYKKLAFASIIKSSTLIIIQILLGTIKSGYYGLIMGYVISQLIVTVFLFKTIVSDFNLFKNRNKFKILALMKKYKSFPIFSTWAGLANASSFHLTNVLISIIFSTSILGFYSLVQRVLYAPLSLIGNAISQVFFQEANKEKLETGTSKRTFISTLCKLILISFVIYTLLFIIVKYLFVIVFGSEWEKAGYYAQIVIPLLAVQFVVSPLTKINQIYLKNRNVMFWQFGLISLYLLLLFISYRFNWDFTLYLKNITIFVSIYYLFHLYLLYKYIFKEN